MIMRDILFKAKRKDNGEWIDGYYYRILDKGYMLPDMIEVIHETVCQYTGLKDKDGQEIWENDILDDWNGRTAVVKFGKFEIEDEHDCSTTEVNGWYADFIDTNYDYELSNAEIRFCHFLVVGNIFDNPELLEG